MKTKKIIKTTASNDFERICEAKSKLMELIITQPYCKHTVKVELSDGQIFELWASPRLEKVYTA
ncbi:MAG: hypothetical protein IJ136_06435 [Erysipelotrichaceae bacterium]|nr:hypothetical protein [Erysipelotrichaceae bacterium]